MRTRQEIKAIGKSRFQANYWPCVLACLLVALAVAVISGVLSTPAAVLNTTDYDWGTVRVSSSFSILSLLITGPLTIGLCYFFVMNVLGRTDITCTTPFTAAFTNYGRKLGGFLWMYLFELLWSLIIVAGAVICGLLVAVGANYGVVPIVLGVLILIGSCVPLLIKTLSYAMTTYILADCPNVRAQDALKLSIRIMDGHKWELFVFYLSFFGWAVLSALTLGLLALFYVAPYMNSSLAVYYLEVREEALRTGVITMGQLEGSEAV